MILFRIIYFYIDMMRSMFRTLYASLRGPEQYTMGWASLYVGGLSPRQKWWAGHVATVSPATIVIVRSYDDNWVYVHTLFGDEEGLKSYEKTMSYVLNLPKAPTGVQPTPPATIKNDSPRVKGSDESRTDAPSSQEVATP